jgi:hypothetical protein
MHHPDTETLSRAPCIADNVLLSVMGIYPFVRLRVHAGDGAFRWAAQADYADAEESTSEDAGAADVASASWGDYFGESDVTDDARALDVWEHVVCVWDAAGKLTAYLCVCALVPHACAALHASCG